jgi:hypothetical protein
MSMIRIQEYAMGAFRVSKLAKCKKGQTIKARFEAVRVKYIGMLTERGWSEADAAIIVKDAEDMAMLELGAS